MTNKLVKYKEVAETQINFENVIKKFINDLNISPKGTVFTAEGDAICLRFKSHISSINFEQYYRAIKNFPFSKGYHGALPTREHTTKYDLVFFGLESDDIKQVAKNLTEHFKTSSF